MYAWAIVSEYILSSPLAFLDNLRFSVGFISASRAPKVGDASQLYYTDVVVTNMYIFCVSRLLPQRKRKYSQNGWSSWLCQAVGVRCWVGFVGGFKCLSRGKSSKGASLLGETIGWQEGKGAQVDKMRTRSWAASRATVWFQDSHSHDAACWWGHLVQWCASLWATSMRPWQPLTAWGSIWNGGSRK